MESEACLVFLDGNPVCVFVSTALSGTRYCGNQANIISQLS